MIHPTAIIAPGARIGADVEIGPFSVIGEQVTVGDRVRIAPHVHLTGHTTIGSGTRIHTGAVIGDEPQDIHYKGAPCEVRIGKNCVFREYVTIHRSKYENGLTSVGDDVMLMANVHIAHDCIIGNGVVIANATLVAGHVEVGERAFISGAVVIHQFCRIGQLAMIGGATGMNKDVPPYCLFQLRQVLGLNTIGLRRAGFDVATRLALKKAYKLFFRTDIPRTQALAEIEAQLGSVPPVMEFVNFIKASKRGIEDGPRAGVPETDETPES